MDLWVISFKTCEGVNKIFIILRVYLSKLHIVLLDIQDKLSLFIRFTDLKVKLISETCV